MSTCSVWWSLPKSERKSLLKCEFHPYQDSHDTSECNNKKPRFPCQYCKSTEHHFLLCGSHKTKSHFTRLQTYTVRAPTENNDKGKEYHDRK